MGKNLVLVLVVSLLLVVSVSILVVKFGDTDKNLSASGASCRENWQCDTNNGEKCIDDLDSGYENKICGCSTGEEYCGNKCGTLDGCRYCNPSGGPSGTGSFPLCSEVAEANLWNCDYPNIYDAPCLSDPEDPNKTIRTKTCTASPSLIMYSVCNECITNPSDTASCSDGGEGENGECSGGVCNCQIELAPYGCDDPTYLEDLQESVFWAKLSEMEEYYRGDNQVSTQDIVGTMLYNKYAYVFGWKNNRDLSNLMEGKDLTLSQMCTIYQAYCYGNAMCLMFPWTSDIKVLAAHSGGDFFCGWGEEKKFITSEEFIVELNVCDGGEISTVEIDMSHAIVGLLTKPLWAKIGQDISEIGSRNCADKHGNDLAYHLGKGYSGGDLTDFLEGNFDSIIETMLQK